jgi:hypothetical protein
LKFPLRPSTERSSVTALINLAIVISVALGTIQCVLIFRTLNGCATHRDFPVYYLSAKAIEARLNPYAVDFTPTTRRLGWDTGGMTHATDPPTFLLMIGPLAHFSLQTAFWIWTAFNAACLALSIFLLFGPGSGIPSRAVWILAPLLTFFVPLRVHFSVGQTKLPVLLLLVLAMRLMQSKRDGAAGLALSAAILTRIFPVVLLGYLLLQCRWRMLVYAFAGLLAGGLVTALVLGTENCLSFARGMSTLTTHWTAMPQDLATNAFISRLFWHFFGKYPSTRIGQLRDVAIASANLLLVGLAILATLASPQRAARSIAGLTVATPPCEDPDWKLFSLWIVTSVLLSPIAWIYYQVLYIVLFARIASAASASRASRRAVIMTLVCIATMYVWILIGLDYSNQTDLWWKYVLSEFGFLSMLTGYIAAYWFATDDLHVSSSEPRTAVPFFEMVTDTSRD